MPACSDFVKTWIHRATVDSTSLLARKLVCEGAADLPMLVIADQQTAGRGQGSRTWWSDEGSLTFSIGLNPADHGLRFDHGPRVALAVAVAIVDALESTCLPSGTVGIRWPNDVEAQGKKLAGILPEWVETPAGRRIVIGVGVNVSTDLTRAPSDVCRMATTIHAISAPRKVGKEAVLESILKALGPTLRALARDDRELAERWSQRDTLRGHRVRIDLGTQIISGLAMGISETGGLLLHSGEPGSLFETELQTMHGGRVLRNPQ